MSDAHKGSKDDSKRRQAEWLTTNRRGCYAMGTTGRTPTRKYHGLLVARGAAGQLDHILADVSDVVRAGGVECSLASFHYDVCTYPEGHRWLRTFEPTPRWVFAWRGVVLERRLQLDPSAPRVTIEYRVLESPGELELELSPLLTVRCADYLAAERDGVMVDLQLNGEVVVRFDPHAATAGSTVITGSPPGGAEPAFVYDPSPYWNRRVHYPEELARGYPCVEDLFAPGRWRATLTTGQSVAFSVEWIEEGAGFRPPSTALATEGDASLPSDTESGDLVQRLHDAAAAYCIDTSDGSCSVVAGYPWFGEWGRDAFIALPGLTIARGKTDIAARVLDRFRDHRKHGVIPNIVGNDDHSTDDHSVDATLFFVRAVEQVEESAGPDVANRWWPDVLDLLRVLRAGQASGIVVEESGLLRADRRPRAMTWMDALVDGVAVTPRAPYAVEIQALFHRAIDYAIRIAERTGDSKFSAEWSEIAGRLRESFLDIFAGAHHLADSSDGTLRDDAVRPNQLYAVAGPRPLVSGRLAAGVLASVRRCLLTPVGLRTLDPASPEYRGRCEGEQRERDFAYHQGTVWPWLLGPYVDAVVAVEGITSARAEAIGIVRGFAAHLDEACLGHISEIFDGDAPHTPRGAPAQAWSVAELLRIARL